jgi:hypothetical protein
VTAAPPFVLAVGVNRAPSAEMTPLRFADDDAAAALLVFGDLGDRGLLLATLDDESQERFPALRARARPASLAQLRLAVDELARAVSRARESGEFPVVIVWLVGHGAWGPDGKPYLTLEDGALTPDVLGRDVLAPLSAAHRVHVLMDACHAGAMIQWRAAVQPATDDEVRGQLFLSGLSVQGHVGLMTAAGAQQKTYEWEETRSGVFSSLVRSALRGAANADADPCVSYDEVEAYVSAALQGIPLPEARPRVVSRAPAVDRRAALSCPSWFTQTRTLSTDLGALGTLRVQDAHGAWLAGGRFEPGHAAVMALPGEGPLTVSNDEGEWLLQEAGESGLVLAPAPVRDAATARGVVARAVREGLFKVPYGPSYLAGFRAGGPKDPPPPASPPTAPAPSPGPGWGWVGLLSAPPGVLGAAGAVTASVLALAGLWQVGRYLSTDLQRQAREAQAAAAVALVAGGVAAAGSVVLLGVATAWVVAGAVGVVVRARE